MYSVSQVFKDSVKLSQRSFISKVTVNDSLEYEDGKIVDFTVEDSISTTDEFTIGQAISSRLDITISTIDNFSSGDKIVPYLKMEAYSGAQWQAVTAPWQNATFPWGDNTTEWMPLGEFYIKDKTYKDNVWKLTAYDGLYKAQTPFESSLAYPATMANVFNEICTKLGYAKDSSVVFNTTYTINQKPSKDDYNYIDILGYIASAYATSIRMTKDGKLTFINFKANISDEITKSDYFKMERINDVKTYTKIEVESGTSDAPAVYTRGTGDEVATLRFKNPFMSQTILNNVYNILNGFSYTPYIMDWKCFLYLETGDFINIEYTDSETWERATVPWQNASYPWDGRKTASTIILYNKISYKGGLKATTYAKSITETDTKTTYIGPVTRSINDLNLNTVRQDRKYYGVSVNNDNGLVIEGKNGNKTVSKAVFNSDEFVMAGLNTDGEWEDGVYFDREHKQYIFNGALKAGSVEAETIISVGTDARIGKKLYIKADGVNLSNLDSANNGGVIWYNNSNRSVAGFFVLSGGATAILTSDTLLIGGTKAVATENYVNTTISNAITNSGTSHNHGLNNGQQLISDIKLNPDGTISSIEYVNFVSGGYHTHSINKI